MADDDYEPLHPAGSLRKAWVGWRWTATTSTADGTVVEQGKGWERMLLWAEAERNHWLINHGATPLSDPDLSATKDPTDDR